MRKDLRFGHPNLLGSTNNKNDHVQFIRHRSPTKEQWNSFNSLRRKTTLIDDKVSLFDIIHSKFFGLGHGLHGAPIKDFKYHLDQARWISIEPVLMGKVVVSNTCSKVGIPHFLKDMFYRATKYGYFKYNLNFFDAALT